MFSFRDVVSVRLVFRNPELPWYVYAIFVRNSVVCFVLFAEKQCVFTYYAADKHTIAYTLGTSPFSRLRLLVNVYSF